MRRFGYWAAANPKSEQGANDEKAFRKLGFFLKGERHGRRILSLKMQYFSTLAKLIIEG